MEEDGSCCLNLEFILGKFSAPITEEHGWAVVYQTLKCLESLTVERGQNQAKVQRRRRRAVRLVNCSREIFLNGDGSVHEATFLDPVVMNSDGSTSTRPVASSVEKVIDELALVIYSALDFGIKDAHERQLSPEMENLLHIMTSMDSSRAMSYPDSDSDSIDADDEGIEQDHDIDLDSMDHLRSLETSPSQEADKALDEGDPDTAAGLQSIRNIKKLCESHLSVVSEAEAHYRKVCRALVSEARELTLFLIKTQNHEDMHSKELNKLAQKDWAHLWITTMEELRLGVKLKKIDHTRTPFEYALTPYEILMDDIRFRKYKLNRVMVDGQIPPNVKMDAHDVILDFIRSRPPLRPVAERKLNPIKRKYSTPQELLMTSIRTASTKPTLRKTLAPPSPKLSMPANWSSVKIFQPEESSSMEEDEEGYPDGCSPRIVVSSNLVHEPVGFVRANNRQRQPPTYSQTKKNHSASEWNLSHRPGWRPASNPNGFTPLRPFDHRSGRAAEGRGPEIQGSGLGRSASLKAVSRSACRVVPADRDLTSRELNDRIMVLRKKRNPAARSMSAAHHQRPVSLSCVDVNGGMIREEERSAIAGRRRVLIRPDPSFLRSFEDSDPEDEAGRPPDARDGTTRIHSASAWNLSVRRGGPAPVSPNSFASAAPRRSFDHRSAEDRPTGIQPSGLGRSFSLKAASKNAHRRLGLNRVPEDNGVGQWDEAASRFSATCLADVGFQQHLAESHSRKVSPSPRRPTSFSSAQTAFGRRRGQDHLMPNSSNLGAVLTSPSGSCYPLANASTTCLDQWHSTPMSSATPPPGYSSPRKTLNLSRDEISHVRSVLVRAKMEALPLTDQLRSDLEKARTCFLCTEVKFGFFSWAYTCKLCLHSFCSGCVTKVAVPDELFRNVPVGFLSPALAKGHATGKEKSSVKKKLSFWSFGRGGKDVDEDSSSHGAASLEPSIEDRKQRQLKRANTISYGNDIGQSPVLSKCEAPVCQVCLECRNVIENIAKRRH